jgi:DNA replication protein DnaC
MATTRDKSSLQNSPECTLCGGSGWKTIADPARPGRSVATRCDCQIRLFGARLLEQSRIPKRYQHCDFDNFEHFGSFASLEPAFIKSKGFAEQFPLEKAGLLIIGPIGVGKTHLAVSIMKELISTKNVRCLFYDYRELLKEIQNSYNSSVQATEMEVLQPVFDTEVLVLDELGAVKPSEWVWDTVSHILNTRYNEEKTTIITTNFRNLPPGGGETDRAPGYGAAVRQSREETLGDRIGERMRSRLHEMCRIVQVDGEDFRMKVKSAGLR